MEENLWLFTTIEIIKGGKTKTKDFELVYENYYNHTSILLLIQLEEHQIIIVSLIQLRELVYQT